ncbi:MAG: hypothetical protein ACLFOY_09170 [Desulfatibacillaceae bacterium]
MPQTTQLKAQTGPPGQANGAHLAEKLVGHIMRTHECRQITGALIPEVLRMWAGDSGFKKLLSSAMAKDLKKIGDAGPGAAESVAEAMSDPEFTEAFLEMVPELVNTATAVFTTIYKTVDGLPQEKRVRFFGEVLSNIDYALVGELVTSFVKVVNEIHKENPTFMADSVAGPLRGLISRTDFGELEEFLADSREDMAALAGALTDALWEYPAKMVCLMGCVPALTNTTSSMLISTLTRVNAMAPDLLTEVSLSLLRDVDGKALGTVVNETAEVLRKMHTGSALLGPPGLPKFTSELAVKLAEIGSEIDPTLLWKARSAVAEIRESRLTARTELLRNNPELLTQRLHEQPSLRNARIRSMRRSVELLADLPEEDAAEAIAEGALKVDAQELAEMVSTLSMVLNRVRDEKPDFVMNMLYHFANSVDVDELSDTAKWMIDDIREAMRPLGRAVLPTLIKGLVEWLSPEDDDYNEEVTDSLAALRDLLDSGQEAPA